jgi:hypothetical protein
MNSFLDTCIIISAFDKKDKFYKKSEEFVTKNENLIISVYQDKKELPFLFFRKVKIIVEAIKSSAIKNYTPNLDKLTKKDQIILKKTITKLNLFQLSQQELFDFKKDLILLKQEITYFINSKISKKVIPLEKIDLKLVSKIKEEIKNEADSNILSSAIQENQDQENRLKIITNDANDWKKDILIKVLKDTEYKEIPEIEYLF